MTANTISMKPRLLLAVFLANGLFISVPLFAVDQTPPPARAVVQISVTDVDAPDGMSLPSPAGVRDQKGPQDDLRDLKSDADQHGISLSITPRFNITTFDGAAGKVKEETLIPYVSLHNDPGFPPNLVHYAGMTSSLSATPHVNKDGTITVEFIVVESRQTSPAWRELGPPTITNIDEAAKLTLHNGDTLAVSDPAEDSFLTHRMFLTVKLVQTAKG